MKLKTYFFVLITLFMTIFAYGDSCFLELTNSVFGVSTNEHHHLDLESHELEHKNEQHSNNCEDECHFCFFTGGITTFISQFPEFFLTITMKGRFKRTFFYVKNYSDKYLAGIWQPPRFC